MTNKEYYTKNNISFGDALRDFDAMKYGCVENWLMAERKPKFKVGDIVAAIKGGTGSFCVNIIISVEDDKYITAFYTDEHNWSANNAAAKITFDKEHTMEKIGVCTNTELMAKIAEMYND